MRKRLFALGLLLLSMLALPAASNVARAQDNGFPEFPKGNPYGAFINSHQFAIDAGATAEWRKMEGVAFDAKRKRLYIAISEVAKGMSDTKGDIQLPENKCGAVMEAQLDDGFNISALKPLVVGGPYDANNKDNPCNTESISNPDNLFVDPKGNLWIGEDTDYHANNYIWMWDGKQLKRFASLPSGAEATGLRIEPDGTIFSNVQHPDAMNPYPFNRGVVGVITGFRAGWNFRPVPVPTGEAQQRVVVAGGNYQILARAGESIPGSAPSEVYGEVTKAAGGIQSLCNNPDGNMFLPTKADGSEGYLYTNFECQPGAAVKQYIQRGKANGREGIGNAAEAQSADPEHRGVSRNERWNVIEGQMVDFRAVGGTWNNCNASVTPWNTALTSEEYPPDVASEWPYWLASKPTYSSYLGSEPNPYNVGYAIEITPDGLGSKVVKHYAMGRLSREMALVMPDLKTTYFGDDGTDRVLYKFVADKAGDLSAGTLYAAKISQDGATLNLNWIKLGSGNDAEIGKAIQALAPKP